MSVLTSGHGSGPSLPRPELSRGARVVLGVGALEVVALAVGVASVRYPLLAVGFAVLPAAFALLVRPELTVVLILTAVPFSQDLANGALPAKIGASDLLLTLALAGLTVGLLLREDVRRAVRPLKPVFLPFGVYFGALVVVLAAHPDVEGAINGFQRLQLTLLPALLAGAACSPVTARRALRGFVLAASVLALAFVASLGTANGEVFGVQKNPAGQFMASGVLLVLAAPGLGGRWRLLIFPLAAGVVASQSRGALLALGISLAVLVAIRGSVPRGPILAGSLVLGTLGYATFQALPMSAQERLLTTDSRDDFALKVRDAYRADAEAVIRAHPLVGVGVGSYVAGDVTKLEQTSDPHNVLLLELAEGGVILGGSLVFLLVGPLVVLIRQSRHSPAVALAVAVQTGIVVHGLVDTYWVRSTPVLGWFLIGLAFATVKVPDRTQVMPQVAA